MPRMTETPDTPKGRVLRRTTQELENGIRLSAVPYDFPKGRHWIAQRDDLILGEFKSHQRNTYRRQPEGHYGRADGTYQSVMVRESWIADRDLGGKPESARNPDRERQFNDWKKALRTFEPRRPGGWVIPKRSVPELQSA